MSKQQVASDDKGEEIEKECNGEDLEILRGNSDGVSEHVHLFVELKQLKELDGGKEYNKSCHVAIELVIQGQ